MKVFLILSAFLFLAGSCRHKPYYAAAPFDGRQATIDISGLQESAPEFYTVVLGEKRIDFFVVMVNGELAAYFDACKECYFKKQGYRHDNGAMLCRACNIRFPMDKLRTGIGGCYPIRVNGFREGSRYIISGEALEAGKKYF